MLALSLDWTILLAIVAPIWLAIARDGDANAHDAADFLVGNLLMYVAPFLYWALLSRLGGGRTPGRWMLGIRLIGRHGDRVSYWRTLARTLLVVPLLIVVIPALLDLLWPLLGHRGQSFCDRATSTVVTRA